MFSFISVCLSAKKHKSPLQCSKEQRYTVILSLKESFICDSLVGGFVFGVQVGGTSLVSDRYCCGGGGGDHLPVHHLFHHRDHGRFGSGAGAGGDGGAGGTRRTCFV